ncbi:DUF6708 domain-containing protein [Aliamphritea ceti]|uniref:DUF6708 domain-containing protein n=1 Tax=Aliamphritea ceti TaxID=1524258 RepID=UPI0021C349A8|nr:DUF6708 domain-containing protein [Aliamphritea ceti]
MKKQIDKTNPNAWIAPKQNGYSPTFRNTKARRGKGLGTAFGKGVVMEDVLNPPAKIIPRDKETKQVQQNGCLLFGAGNHGHYMDMRVNSVTNREMLTRAAQVFFVLIFLPAYLIIRSVGYGWFELHIVELCFLAGLLALILFDFLKPIATPVRFNYKTQEVYAYHKGALYRIPWNECEIACMYAPDYMELGGLTDAYNLNLWLYPQHCVNGKAGKEPVPLVLLNEGSAHDDIYDYWEYVRAYMTEGPDKVYTYDDDGSRAYFVDFSKLSLRLFIELPFIFIVYSILEPRKIYVWLNPFKKKWPKEVHEWTGETVNWH